MHAALALCTKDLSHLLRIKSGDLSETEHTIDGNTTNVTRSCRSIEETQASTKVRTQTYMSPPPVEKQCLFGELVSDRVGHAGFKLDPNYTINDATMQQCNPDYSQLNDEAKEQVKQAFHEIGSLVDSILLFIQNNLVSRCPHCNIKAMTRIPIPKGLDKTGQTRFISLADDMFSFLIDQVARDLSGDLRLRLIFGRTRLPRT